MRVMVLLRNLLDAVSRSRGNGRCSHGMRIVDFGGEGDGLLNI